MCRLLLLSIVCALAVAACGGVHAVSDQYDHAPFTYSHQHKVCEFAAGLPEEYRYVKLAHIKATKRTYGSVDELPSAMADEARRDGADAILYMQADQKIKGLAPWRLMSPTGDGVGIKMLPDSPPLDCEKLGGKLY